MAIDHIHSAQTAGTIMDFGAIALAALAIFFYLQAAVATNKKMKTWPLSRIIYWHLGILCLVAVFVGPIGDRAHTDFTVHMIGHLLLGMLAPLLIVLSAPMTLALRTLSTAHARKVTRVLRSLPLRLLSHPLTAAVLNVGGLYVLYRTELYVWMHESVFVSLLVHFHMFAAGYLFTASIIYIDPTPHRFSFSYRSAVLIVALAGHAVLSKMIYAHPPEMVSESEGRTAGMLMYYGGDAIDLILIFILWMQWYKAVRPKAMVSG